MLDLTCDLLKSLMECPLELAAWGMEGGRFIHPTSIPKRAMMAPGGLITFMSGFTCLNVRLVSNKDANLLG